jgi:hypothetical protein
MWLFNKNVRIQFWPFEFFLALIGEWGLELNLYRQCQWAWIDLKFSIDRCIDHAGFHFYFEVIGFSIQLEIYDSRHWNYEAKRWYLPGEESDEIEKNL